MKPRPFIALLALVLASFTFSGCFEIFYDIIHHPDGTYGIRQTVGLSDSFFDMMASFASTFGKDSTDKGPGVTAADLRDSSRRSFYHRRDSIVQAHGLIGQAGITALNIHDTTIDSVTYFTIESSVSNLDSLPSAFHLLQGSSKVLTPGSSPPGTQTSGDTSGEDEVALIVSKTKQRTTITFRPKQPDEQMEGMDAGQFGELFKGIQSHYRVYSASLEKPKDKNIKTIPGGQERVLSLDDIGKMKNKRDITFSIKN